MTILVFDKEFDGCFMLGDGKDEKHSLQEMTDTAQEGKAKYFNINEPNGIAMMSQLLLVMQKQIRQGRKGNERGL